MKTKLRTYSGGTVQDFHLLPFSHTSGELDIELNCTLSIRLERLNYKIKQATLSSGLFIDSTDAKLLFIFFHYFVDSFVIFFSTRDNRSVIQLTVDIQRRKILHTHGLNLRYSGSIGVLVFDNIY